MSIPISTADEDPPAPDHWPGGLAALRDELDGIDDGIHDLLMRRAAVIGRVAETKAGSRTAALRPGREAAILRRLLSRHSGTLPRQAIVRIWRELLAATTAMQGTFVIAVAEPEPGAGLTQAAREQFGALTPQRVHGSAAQAIADVSAGRASVAVLPVPSEGEPAGRAWWTALMQKDEPRIHVVSRLPFWTRRTDGAPSAQAMVAASFAPDPSGADRSLLGLELDRDVSRARLTAALSAAGLGPGSIIIRRDAGSPAAQALVEVEGYVTDDDARLTSPGTGFHKPVVLGAYAIPLGDPA